MLHFAGIGAFLLCTVFPIIFILGEMLFVSATCLVLTLFGAPFILSLDQGSDLLRL